MIIFQRVVTFDQGQPQDVVPWAMEVCEHVNNKTDANVSLWQGLSGGPIGTLAWSSIRQSMTELETTMDSLAADTAYLDLVSKARDWVTTPGEDHFLRVMHTSHDEYVRPDVGAYAEGISAVPAEGKIAAAGAFGVEIADIHSELTHSSVILCSAAYGQFGEMRWLSLYDDAAALDNAADQIAKDADYTAKIDGAGQLFTPGSSTRTLARRLA